MLLAIAHKNAEIQHLLNIEIPFCGPRLDEMSFSILVCLPLNNYQTYKSSNKSVCFHFNTQADIIQAGGELLTESVMAFLIENCNQRKSSWVLYSISLMYVLQFEDGRYIFYSITPTSVGRCNFQTEICTSGR